MAGLRKYAHEPRRTSTRRPVHVLPYGFAQWSWPHSTRDYSEQWSTAENVSDRHVFCVVEARRAQGILRYFASKQYSRTPNTYRRKWIARST
jgi:hypothetical protein